MRLPIEVQDILAMVTPGYYALPLTSLPLDVYQNLDKLTLFRRPDRRIISLANELVTSSPVLAPPSIPRDQMDRIVKVRIPYK